MKKYTISASLALVVGIGMGMSAQAAVSDNVIRIGFITDMSGVYSDSDGKNGLNAIKLAIDDMGGSIDGKKIELLYADHQNKADIASAKAREWFDQNKVDAIIGGSNSAAAIAIAKVASEKKKPVIIVGAASSAITGKECTPYSILYSYNTRALANVTGSELVKDGYDSWFFVTADYAFGHALEGDAADLVSKAGGQVKGKVRVPLGTTDFSSYMLQAQSSGAKVLGLANAGADFVNAMKAYSDFGLAGKMKPAGFVVYLTDIYSLGLQNTQGLYLSAPWYWNQDKASAQWAARFVKVSGGKKPTFVQAGDYSATLTYLKAVKATGSDDSQTIMKYLKSHKINDFYMQDGYVRPDGLTIHSMLLLQVKKPEESKESGDFYNVISKVSGETAFGPESESACKVKDL